MGRSGHHHMAVGFTTSCAIMINVYHHLGCEFESCTWRGVLGTTLCEGFFSDLWQGCAFLQIFGFFHQ